MNFKVNVMRSAAMAGVAVALLASCGGGTQIEAFVPRRVIAFGDEASLIEPDPGFAGQGRKYTVNGVATDATTALPVVPTQRVCATNQVWTQQLAYSFGFAFPDCATAGYTANSVMRAQAGAQVAQLTAQVTSFLASDAFGSNDLVTVMVGTNDIIFAAENSADPVAAVQAAGTQVGAEVVRITDRGAKVIVSTVPSLGFAPYAISRETTTPGTVARMSNLSEQFNTALRLKLREVRDGGRAVGLVLADELVLAMTRNPAGYGVINITLPICPTTGANALPNCDMTNITPAAIDPTGTTTTYGYDWLWADDRHLGANAQTRLGSLAVSRARSNPF
jgi:outer membrane lipase/esterase